MCATVLISTHFAFGVKTSSPLSRQMLCTAAGRRTRQLSDERKKTTQRVEGEPAAVFLGDPENNVTDSTVGYMYTKLTESILC
jgi:hypothetical protein